MEQQLRSIMPTDVFLVCCFSAGRRSGSAGDIADGSLRKVPTPCTASVTTYISHCTGSLPMYKDRGISRHLNCQNGLLEFRNHRLVVYCLLAVIQSNYIAVLLVAIILPLVLFIDRIGINPTVVAGPTAKSKIPRATPRKRRRRTNS